MYEIEKSVPIPKAVVGFRGAKTKGKSVYPIHEMEVGDSFFVPSLNHGIRKLCSRIIGKKFLVRKEGEGTRIWRVA